MADTAALANYEPPKGAGKGIQALKELDFKQMMYVGELMFAAQMFTDLKSAAQAQVKIMAGQELGLAPMQSMNAFHIIHGRVAMAANTMAAKVKEHPQYDYDVKELTDQVCIIEFSKLVAGKWVPKGLSSFSAEDARKAGTQNMGKFPRNMLFARAMSNGVRWYCPDVFDQPVYDEYELVNEEPPAKTPDEEAAEEEEAKKRVNRGSKLKRSKPAETAPESEADTEPANTPEAARSAPNEPTEAPAIEPEEIPSHKIPKEGVDPRTVELTEPANQVEGDPSTYMAPVAPEPAAVPFDAETEPDDSAPHTPKQKEDIMDKLRELGFESDSEKRQVVAGILGLDQIVRFSAVTYGQAKQLLEGLAVTDGSILRGMFIKDGGEDGTTA
jgi:hypothetical protein